MWNTFYFISKNNSWFELCLQRAKLTYILWKNNKKFRKNSRKRILGNIGRILDKNVNLINETLFLKDDFSFVKKMY